jgi:hypothetical protein
MQQVSEKDSRDMEACGWDDDFWEEIGLGDLVDGHHAKIGMLVGQFLFCFFSLVTGLLDNLTCSAYLKSFLIVDIL